MQPVVSDSNAPSTIILEVLDRLPDGIVVIGEDDRVLYQNEPASALVEAFDVPAFLRIVRRLEDRTWVEVELAGLRFAEINAVPIAWAGAPARLVTLRDITERRRAQASLAVLTDELRSANAQLQMLAEIDPLTGLLNRRGLKRVLDAEIAPRMRLGYDLVAVMIDCDRFKSVNDTLGHVAGDVVLRSIAQRLRGVLRPADPVARVGGDEFLVLLPGGRHADALRVANRIRDVIGRSPVPVPHCDREVRLTVSVGVAQIPRHVRDPEEIVRRADARLRQSKLAGKNRVTGPDRADEASSPA